MTMRIDKGASRSPGTEVEATAAPDRAPRRAIGTPEPTVLAGDRRRSRTRRAGEGSASAAGRTRKDTKASVATPETALYAPVKALLETQGYDVKGEVRGCDLVGVRGSEPPVVVELKRAFGLGLVMQGIDRLAMTDAVYLAVGDWPKRPADIKKLCRRVGLGLMVVTGARVEVMLDPLPYRPRKDPRRAARLLGEHQRRVGDPTVGGATRRPIVTAYRQDALRCAAMLAAQGPMKPAALRDAVAVAKAAGILRRNVYGWFERVAHGVYAVTPAGAAALVQFSWPPAPAAVSPGGDSTGGLGDAAAGGDAA